tara:strand:+ start:10749 stop:11918 length:1170 start_codon:yes stop_codon:yes gene_type:complete
MSKKVLLLCDTYYPDKTSGAKLLFDLSGSLSKSNQILVIVARNSNFSEIFNIPRIINKQNLKIIFIPCFKIKSHNYIIRGISEFLMSFILWYRSKRIVYKFKPTSVVVYSPSIFFGYFCSKIKKNFNVKSLCIMRDLFPYWAIEVGYIKNFFLKRFFIKILNNFISNFNNIGLESKTNIKIMKSRFKNNFFYLPNWVDLKNFKFNKIKKNKKKLNFVFAGNIGGGQDIEKVLKFIALIPEDILNKFYIVGEGKTSYKIKRTNLLDFKNKIILKKRVSQENYIKFLKKMDIGIVSLNDKIKSVNFPGRLFSYLMANKPIILLTEKNNELSKFVDSNQIGVNVSINKFSNKKFLRIKKINNKFKRNNLYAFNFLKKNFSLSKIITQIESNL